VFAGVPSPSANSRTTVPLLLRYDRVGHRLIPWQTRQPDASHSRTHCTRQMVPWQEILVREPYSDEEAEWQNRNI
jgi:hypothetical protein